MFNFRVHGGISRTTGDRYDRGSDELGTDIHKIVKIVKNNNMATVENLKFIFKNYRSRNLQKQKMEEVVTTFHN
jgi:hypothetical protein